MKKLGLEEKLVLQLVLLQAEVPIPELAKQAGMRPHKLRYILSSFEESGVFHRETGARQRRRDRTC